MLAAAKSLGYQNDPRFAYLSRLRWGAKRSSDTVVVALLLDRYTSRNPSKFTRLKETAARYGYKLEMILLEQVQKENRNLSRELYHRGIQGLLINIHDESVFPEMEWQRFTW